VYKILGADKKEYGPVSAEVLRQWIADRRANAETRVQAEGSGDWQPLSDFVEFAEALAGSARAATPPPPQPRASVLSKPLQAAKTSAMAVTSLILGILGAITCGVTALIGIVLGIISLLRIRNSDGKISGQGIAIAGICVSGVFLLFAPIALGLFLPALAKARARAQSVQCENNMKQIGLAARMWARDHNGMFPQQLGSLTNEVEKPSIFSCPGDSHARAASDWSHFNPRDISYEYLGAGLKESNPRAEIVRCPIHGHVVLGDGSVQQGRSH